MIHAPAELRDQRALDVAHGLLWLDRIGRQHMDLVDRAMIIRHDTHGKHTLKGGNELLCTTNGKNTPSNSA